MKPDALQILASQLENLTLNQGKRIAGYLCELKYEQVVNMTVESRVA